MGLLDAAVEHYRKQRKTLHRIEVPEWPDADGKPGVIYFSPSVNLYERGKILAAANGENPAESLALTVILRALDADGKRLFKEVELDVLMREVDEDVLGRVAHAMRTPSNEIDIEAKKNS